MLPVMLSSTEIKDPNLCYLANSLNRLNDPFIKKCVLVYVNLQDIIAIIVSIFRDNQLYSTCKL